MRDRTTLAVTAIAALGLLSAPAAQAGRPDRFVEPTYETYVEPSCPDSIAPEGIRWSDAGGNLATQFFDDGSVLKTGRHPDLLTNVATGKSVLLDLEGSISFEPAGDDTLMAMRGTNALVLFPGDAGPGNVDEPRVYAFTGTVRATFDATGIAVTKLEHSGPARDVCAEL